VDDVTAGSWLQLQEWLDFVRAHEQAPERLRDAFRGEGMNAFIAEVLDAAAGGLSEVEELADDDFVIFLEPPSLSDRIVNQYALFSLMSTAGDRATMTR
jgi:hypothetical protein